jgi:hypothetical protein
LLIDALNWLCILLTAYLTGYVLLRMAAKLFRSDLIIAKDSVLAAGTVFLTVFAEICSLFTGVGEAATLLLALITVTRYWSCSGNRCGRRQIISGRVYIHLPAWDSRNPRLYLFLS